MYFIRGEYINWWAKKKYVYTLAQLKVLSKRVFLNYKTSFVQAKYMPCILLSQPIWHIKNEYGVNPALKGEIVKREHQYKVDDQFCLLCMEEKKLAITTDLNSKNILNRKSEILNGIVSKITSCLIAVYWCVFCCHSMQIRNVCMDISIRFS